MSLSLEQYRIAEGRALLATAGEATRTVEADLAQRLDNLRQGAQRPSIGRPSTKAARGILRDFDRALADYLAFSRETMALDRQGGEGAGGRYLRRQGPGAGRRRAWPSAAGTDGTRHSVGGHAAALSGEAGFHARSPWTLDPGRCQVACRSWRLPCVLAAGYVVR